MSPGELDEDVTAALARSVGRAVSNHPVPDPWSPGSAVDDALSDSSQALEGVLSGIGWPFALEDDGGDAIAVPAVELGRGLVSLRSLDAVLGGSPVVGGLVRHGRTGSPAFDIRPGDGLVELRILALDPVAYGDASGVAVLVEWEEIGPLSEEVSAGRLAAWRAASIGYLVGLSGAAFEACLEHVRHREAFGATLAALDVVQAHLADAATALEGARLLATEATSLEGARLLAGEAHSWQALSFAAATAVEVTATCHQLTGALGYTLEYPLQRRSRRARAMRAWAEWAAEAATA